MATARVRTPRARCSAPGCGNFARSGSPFCAAHKSEDGRRKAGYPLARDGSDAIPAGFKSFAERVQREEHERRQAAAAAFQKRLDDGDYRGLFGDRLAGIMEQAAAETGIADELGILRIVQARLLAEVEDPVQQAKALARIISVIIQAQRYQRLISGQVAEALTDAITTILVELESGAEP